ncbi:hypothetical protein RhiirA4_485365 [Rhizophagus irregularis]|uniref:Uncharacterized protein n=1 Tax=Rhizophagus irregularis TaxID=588596 RepID=A0A2I1HQ34_9GLOM|nr:hypothetical protein RhiirA4_485365 [Rhizophagus irregularis]
MTIWKFFVHLFLLLYSLPGELIIPIGHIKSSNEMDETSPTSIESSKSEEKSEADSRLQIFTVENEEEKACKFIIIQIKFSNCVKLIIHVYFFILFRNILEKQGE